MHETNMPRIGLLPVVLFISVFPFKMSYDSLALYAGWEDVHVFTVTFVLVGL